MKRRTIALLFSGFMLMTACGKSSAKTDINSESAKASETETSSIVTETENTEKITETTSSKPQLSETVPQTEAGETETEALDSQGNDEILNDIIFVGDSVTLGFGAYQRVDMDKVYADTGVGPSNIREHTFDYGDKKLEALTILYKEQPKNIVISMGLNDINTYSPENFSDIYMDYAKDVMEVCPDADVYIFAVTPVAADCENIKNETIDGINAYLEKTIANDESGRLFFVDCNSVLKGDNGCMNEKYSSGDGIHITGEAYDLLLENFKASAPQE